MPIARSRVRSSPLPRWKASQCESALTISSSARMGRKLRARGHRRSGAHPGRLDRLSTGSRVSGAARSPSIRGPAPASVGRDEEEQLVDEILREERAGEGRPALEQKRLDALRGERPQLVGERPVRSSSSEPAGSGPRPNASRRGCRAASTPRASSLGLSARTVPIPTATASERARSSCTRRRLSSPETQRVPGHGDAPVERHGDLPGHERPAERDPRAPGLVLRTGRERVDELDLDAGRRGAARSRPPPPGSDRESRRRPSPPPRRRSRPCTAASCRGARRAPSSRTASRRVACLPAASSATISPWRPSASVEPSPTTAPSRTSTAPTSGFGYARPRVASASASARSR